MLAGYMILLLGVHEGLHLLSCFRRVKRVVFNWKVLGFQVENLTVRDILIPQIINPVLIGLGLTGLLALDQALILLLYHLAISVYDFKQLKTVFKPRN